MKKVFLLIVILFHITEFKISAQDTYSLFLEKYDYNEILNEDGINAIIEDHFGFVWIGCWNGLFRLDGHQVVNITNEYGGQIGKKIRELFISKDSIVWIGTYGQGLYTFDINTNEIRNFMKSTKKNSLRDIFAFSEDEDGSMWIGANDALFHYKDSALESFPLKHTIENVEKTLLITTVVNLNKSNLLVGTNHGVFKFNTTKKTFQKLGNKVSSYVSTMIRKEDKVWVCSQEGLFYCNANSELSDIQLLYFDILKDGRSLFATSIFPVSNRPNHFWVTTQNQLYIINDQSNTVTPVKTYSTSNKKLNVVSSLCFENQSNVLWIGSQYGLFKANNNPRMFTPYLTNEERKMVFALAADKHNNLWIGTWGEGLFLMDISDRGNTFNYKKIDFGNSYLNNYDKFIYTVCASKDGENIWFGTKGAGIVKLHLKNGKYSGKHTSYNSRSVNGIKDNYIMNIVEAEDGTIYAGSWDGFLYCYNKNQNRFIEIKYNELLKDKNSSAILKIYPTKDNQIVLGTFGHGAIQLKINDKTKEVISSDYLFYRKENNYLRANFVYDIASKDNQGILLGTDQGLYNVKGKDDFIEYNTSEGLLSASILTLHEDSISKYWVATEGGLSNVTFKKDTISSIKNYTSSDGLQKNLFHPRAITVSKDKRIFMGSSNGFISFAPLKAFDLKSDPTVLLTDLKVLNIIIEPKKKYSNKLILAKTISKTEKIELSSNQNMVSLGFSSMNHLFPYKVKYAYKLEGYNKDWIYVDANYPRADFMKIPPGNWTFKVKCTNSDGNWSEKTTNLTIKVNPPWWKTNYAYILYSMLFVALIFLIVYMVRFKHRIELSSLEYKKDLEVFDLQLNFYTNISHELRTPLTLIIGSVSQLMLKEGDNNFYKENITKIDRYAKILRKLVDEIMDLRKIEKDTISLKLRKLEAWPFVKLLCENFAHLFIQKGILFEFKTHISGCAYMKVDELRFESIIYNLLSNAFKFSPPNGQVRCELWIAEKTIPRKSFFNKKSSQNFVKICISDTGVGIAKEELKHIFEQFYTSKNNIGTTKLAGTGIGLPFVRKLVQLHKGFIEVESELNKGTVFSVYIPLEGDVVTTQIESLSKNELISIPQSDTNNQTTVMPQIQKNKKIILIVDDNEDLRGLIRDSLPSKYQLLEASNGLDALEITQEQIPDLIITDVLMPHISGIELCEKIKSSDLTSHIPVIILTALPSMEDRILGLKMGADSYIAKPFETEHLLIRVEKLIESREKIKNRLLKEYLIVTKNDDLESKPDPNLEFINKVRDFIEKNISDPDFTVADLCTGIGISNMQLFRKLKATIGISANKFIRLMRLQKAKSLFKAGGLNVAEVTYSVGFNDLRYFRTCFKEEFGVTPSEFAKQFNNEIHDDEEE